MLVFFALTLVVLLGFCGLAVDVGLLQLKQLQMQNAADAAANGAIYVLSGGPSAWAAAAKSDAALNGFTDGSNGVSVLPPAHPTSGPYANNSQALQVTITQPVNPIFFPSARTVSAQATALAPASGCVYLLLTNPASGSYDLDDLNSPTIQTSCDVYVNANYSFRGNSITGGQLYFAGTPGSNLNTPAPSPAGINSSVQTDPLGGVQPPSGATCETNPVNGLVNGGSATLYPGTYCSGITINGTTLVTFMPGTYVVYGNVAINGGSVVITGNGVCFYLTKDANTTYGSFSLNAPRFNLSAPTTDFLRESSSLLTGR